MQHTKDHYACATFNERAKDVNPGEAQAHDKDLIAFQKNERAQKRMEFYGTRYNEHQAAIRFSEKRIVELKE
jgi:hypothetical protein